MNNIFKRIGAYLIDMVLITLIGMAVVKISFLNPKYEEYKSVSEEYSNTLMDYYDKKIDIEEFNKKASSLSYDMNKNGYVYLISDIIVIILYFGVFAYFTKGETLGKKLMGLKIVSNSDKPLNIFKLLFRSIFIYNILIDVIALIAICFSRSVYNNIYSIGSNINTLIETIIFISILFSKDGRGLHDKMANTKVIDTKIKNTDIEEKEEEVEIIKPKTKRKDNKNE